MLDPLPFSWEVCGCLARSQWRSRKRIGKYLMGGGPVARRRCVRRSPASLAYLALTCCSREGVSLPPTTGLRPGALLH
jgi:hypothetical protein